MRCDNLKKILKILFVILVFYLSIVIFTTIDFTIVANKYQNEYDTELGLGTVILQIASTWKFTSIMVVLALIAKTSEKLDITIKNTIYFLPLLSIFSFFIIVEPVCKIVQLFGLVSIN